ncbi:hypothetical protein CCR87_01905 [Rhodobaculum claviforme]|uniref:Uncharacterized protein n=1 Tax=Rhodobaculum claviforme TaxID=1549854 RepID=A0A934TGP7_9RHOB|nr:hypothetical protein [Rhodobaculum claviforme]
MPPEAPDRAAALAGAHAATCRGAGACVRITPVAVMAPALMAKGGLSLWRLAWQFRVAGIRSAR